MVAVDGGGRREPIAMNLVPRASAPVSGSIIATVPAIVAAAGDRASLRFLEFFAANIRNPHTRRAYLRAVMDFLAWCEEHQVASIAAVQPLHVAARVEQQTRDMRRPPSSCAWPRCGICSTGW